MIKLTIDGKHLSVREGTSVLEAALQNGIYIPHLCHHPDLPELGSCRLCLVAVDGKAGIESSCMLKAEDGMVVSTRNEEIDRLRSLAMELILAAHPEHCTSCPKFGRCELQLLIQYMDATGSRMNRRVKKIPVNTNPLICHDMQRCVLCGRCVRACKDMRGVNILQYSKKELETYIGTVQNKHLTDVDCRFCGACAEVCPTGAIRDEKNYTAAEKRDTLLPCVASCPAHTNIPEYLRYAKQGEYAKANAVIHEKLPFPETLGRVCSHKCEFNCRRGELNDAVSIREVKRVCAERDSEQLWKANGKLKPDSGKRVAIIGGGPAGITAAIYLRKQGHAVTVYERENKLGGQLQYGIPAYRLPREVVDREMAYAEELGAKIIMNTRIDDFAALKKDYDAVLVTTGTHSGTRLPIAGNQLAGALVCTDFLHAAATGQDSGMGKRVCVLGAGNVAFDCARTAVRLGAEKVYVACRKKLAHIKADKEEIIEAQEEGVEFLDGRSFDAIVGTERVEGMTLSKIKAIRTDENGKSVTELEENSAETVAVDTVIFAVGQRTGLSDKCGLTLGRGGVISTEIGTSATSADGVFACGDVVTGTKSVIEAIAAAREAASEIDIFLGGDGDIEETLFEHDKAPTKIGHIDGFAALARNEAERTSANVRKKGFDEVSKGICQAECEAGRCLQCDLRFNIHPPRTWTSVQENEEGKE